MGAAALEGRPGVVSVEKGWRGTSEVNRVVYNPEEVTVAQMESWLRKVGAYVRTVREPTRASQK
jgi:hypothetical protein